MRSWRRQWRRHAVEEQHFASRNFRTRGFFRFVANVRAEAERDEKAELAADNSSTRRLQSDDGLENVDGLLAVTCGEPAVGESASASGERRR
jgi:hypothetical protein